MSFIGPRPSPMGNEATYTDFVKKKFQVRPGITGYNQALKRKALNGNNFTQTITYLYSSKYYLSGRGLGSCYIAEAYHDFGYIGIVIWSFIYCYVLKNVYSFKNRGII